MGTTIDDIKYEMYIQEKWEDERREVFKALGKIANSRNIDELVKNLKELKNVYISDKPVANENLDEVIGGINFEMLEFKKDIDEKFKKQEKSSRKYFVYGLIAAGIISLIL